MKAPRKAEAKNDQAARQRAMMSRRNGKAPPVTLPKLQSLGLQDAKGRKTHGLVPVS